MPIYEYQCAACGKSLEALQKISATPLLDCPECGEAALKKKISAAAFRLKGGGWYETDFKTGNKKNLAGGSDSAAPSGSGDKASSSGDKASPSGDKASSSGSGQSKKSESTKTA
ncbi:MAG: zinc ribbon domain-containing protein [Gammaproteobacteria bacterium]|nr:MAG: zinc ribbon domain-containing protein [Gammaproteobacteria bacterium]RLA61340.1 MAG: zinc ribbon domain-containing protein [Gammaproteobacteria bacterium]